MYADIVMILLVCICSTLRIIILIIEKLVSLIRYRKISVAIFLHLVSMCTTVFIYFVFNENHF